MDQPIINIIGERVALGPHRRDLIPLHQRWANDFAIARNLGPFGPVTVERQTAWFERLVASEDMACFVIYERATWRPVGSTEWMHINYRDGRADFGIYIGEADARGKGYGTETTRLMLDYAFTALGLYNVALTVATVEGAGGKPAPAVGCSQTNLFRQGQVVVFRMWGTNAKLGGAALTPKNVQSAQILVPGLSAPIVFAYGNHGTVAFWSAPWRTDTTTSIGLVDYTVVVKTKAVKFQGKKIKSFTAKYTQQGLAQPSRLTITP